MSEQTEVAVLREHIVPVFVHVRAFDAQDAITATATMLEAVELDDDPYAPGFVSDIFVGNEKEVTLAPVEDDDPQCACGTYRSEHAMMGCGNFQTPEQCDRERQQIQAFVREINGYIEPEWWK
jgi:hypothetical protein